VKNHLNLVPWHKADTTVESERVWEKIREDETAEPEQLGRSMIN
jgi:hypothetical protein